MPDIERLAINQATTRQQWSLRQAIEGYARHGIRAIGIWRDKLAECGIGEAARLLGDHDMTVTGLCRGGMFPAPDAAGIQAALGQDVGQPVAQLGGGAGQAGLQAAEPACGFRH